MSPPIGRKISCQHNITNKSKGRVTPLQARLWPRGWLELKLYSSMITAPEGGEWSAVHPQERPGTHCTGSWVAPRAGLDGRKISPTGILSPDLPARSQSLYRLSYPAHSLLLLAPCKKKKNRLIPSVARM